MLHRRTFLLSTASVLALNIGCSQQVADTTVQGILDAIKTNCNFITNVQAITAVITTILSGFNAAAGASAVVIASVAKQVEDLVCAAVQKQVAQLKAEDKLKSDAPGATPAITVVVNGVPVDGTYTGS